LSVISFVIGRDRNSRHLLALSGFMAGAAMLIKTVALPYVLLLSACAFFFTADERSWRRGCGNVAVFLIPPIGLALLISGYFFVHEALHDFLFWTIEAPLRYSTGVSGVKGPDLSSVLKSLSHELLLPVLLSTVSAAWLLLRSRELNHILTALLFPVSISAALLPGMHFSHYFIQTVPFMAVLGGIGLGKLLADSKPLFRLAAPLVLVLLCYYLQKDYPLFATLSMREVSEKKFGTCFVDSEKIAHYIRKRTNPDDFIFQWGLEPELYFLSGRRSPVPYIASTTMKLQEDREGAVQHLMHALESRKPTYIVYQAEWADSPGVTDIRMLLERDYFPEIIIGYGQIFRLKGIGKRFGRGPDFSLKVGRV
jgi:hypothetical protein